MTPWLWQGLSSSTNLPRSKVNGKSNPVPLWQQSLYVFGGIKPLGMTHFQIGMGSHGGLFVKYMSDLCRICQIIAESLSNDCRVFVGSWSKIWNLCRIVEPAALPRIYRTFLESASNLGRECRICVESSSNMSNLCRICRILVERNNYRATKAPMRFHVRT